jgi:glucan-binding YG repeat protein
VADTKDIYVKRMNGSFYLAVADSGNDLQAKVLKNRGWEKASSSADVPAARAFEEPVTKEYAEKNLRYNFEPGGSTSQGVWVKPEPQKYFLEEGERMLSGKPNGMRLYELLDDGSLKSQGWIKDPELARIIVSRLNRDPLG